MKKVLSVVFIVCLVLLTACGKNHHHKKQVELLITNPLKHNVAINKDYVCQIRANRHIEVRAMEKGFLEKTYVDEGQQVEKGTLLFQITPTVYLAELRKAQAEYEASKIEYENTLMLREKDIVAPSELKMAEAELKEATAKLMLAQTHFDFTKVNAPFAGLVGRFSVRDGGMVEEGELLTSLADNRKLWVYFNVPEAEYINYKTQDDAVESKKRVKLIMANGKKYPHTGKITAIEADFNNETGNIAFRATFDNPDGLLRHGQTGSVILKTVLPDSIVIPQKATYEILDKHYVFVVDKNNQVHSRSIKIVSALEDVFVVSEGLSEKDLILLNGLNTVRDGEKIHTKFTPASEVYDSLEVYAE